MKRLLLVSLRGGAGATTITANLAKALEKINKHVLAIDVSPENLLQLHLGLSFDAQEGWAYNLLAEKSWYDAGYQCPQGMSFLPFGRLNAEQTSSLCLQKDQLIHFLGRETLRVSENKAELWQVFHGHLSDLAMGSFTDSMDMVLIVLTADASSYAALQYWLLTQEAIQLKRANKLRFVINQYQPETEISRDMMLVLKTELDELSIPVVIHRDTVLHECVANLTTAQQFAPNSQAAKDFQSLAFWIVSTLSTSQLEVSE
ncbi:cellulose biosynthesis protein BcsQ [Vibrio sp. YIC-376]|uniref:cellulose biosynthesis protein BcsQ n=1 Tax=Vibrio sp. YIC-376 TaxID=3136162 RepID=UPI00402A8BCC